MVLEIEGKMRINDMDTVAAVLTAAAGPCCKEVFEINTYFDTVQADLRNSDQGLRVRTERDLNTGDARVMVTHKGPRQPGPLKTRLENEFVANDHEAASRLLEALGYRPVLTFEKRRRLWRHTGCEVVIDSLPYIGDFLEIEGPSQEEVFGVRDKLGLSDQPLIPTSYIAMLTGYIAEHQITGPYIGFETEGRP